MSGFLTRTETGMSWKTPSMCDFIFFSRCRKSEVNNSMNVKEQRGGLRSLLL